MFAQIASLTNKELKILFGDRNGVSTLFFMPAMFIVIMTLALGRLYSSHDPNVPNVVQQNVPAWTLFGVFFISMAVANRLLEEKRLGTWARLKAAPISRPTLLLGKLAPFLLVNLIQVTLMFAVGMFLMPLFGAPRLSLGAHPEAIVATSVAASLAANGLGLLLASMTKTNDAIGGSGNLLLVCMAALGGTMVPRSIMPGFMQQLGLFTPHAWALGAYQATLVRGFGIGQILPQLGVLTLFAVVFFGVALWRFQWD